MLDIVITHCDEPWFICRKQFQMLEMQRIVNWDEIKVAVVNDGGNRLPEEELKKFSFPVEQVDIPKTGVSAARNYGIEHGKEPWIMFCDCDDCFANIYALDEIMTAIRKHPQHDMIWTKCLTEFGRIVIKVAEWRDFTFIHGKAYRRQFLLNTGIRFDEGMTYGEDTKFNEVVISKTGMIKLAETHAPAYVWIRRAGSVTTRKVEEV